MPIISFLKFEIFLGRKEKKTNKIPTAEMKACHLRRIYFSVNMSTTVRQSGYQWYEKNMLAACLQIL